MRLRGFHASCWVLGVIAFIQLITAAVAISVRIEQSREVRVVEKEVTKLVTVRVPANPSAQALAQTGPTPSHPAAEPSPPIAPAVIPAPLATPPIADPVVERLVRDARSARVAEDMGRAMAKLEEARRQAPGEPNTLYELGMVYEQMGIYDKASDFYDKVFQLGTTGAGSLYDQAARKLRDGFEQPNAIRGKLALGRVRIFKDPNFSGGERVVLTIPVQAAPGANVGADDFSVTVRFFDSVKGRDPQPAEAGLFEHSEQWTTLPIDWAGGEELLRATYILKPQDVQQTHLFGERSYYGQVVELRYKNELIDLQSWPRDLAAHTNAPQPAVQPGPANDLPPEFLDKDSLPPGFNPDNPLLPSKPSR
jgi:hypothetical protein